MCPTEQFKRHELVSINQEIFVLLIMAEYSLYAINLDRYIYLRNGVE